MTNIRYRNVNLLPPGTRKNNRYWVMRGHALGRQIECSTDSIDLDAAQRFTDAMLDWTPDQLSVNDRFVFNGNLPSWARKILSAAKARAAKNGTDFGLMGYEMQWLIARANGRCEITGLPFHGGSGGRSSKRRPYIPSLDRIDPAKGYTYSNCRLVAYAVNVALSDWGEAVLEEIAIALTARLKRGQTRG